MHKLKLFNLPVFCLTQSVQPDKWLCKSLQRDLLVVHLSLSSLWPCWRMFLFQIPVLRPLKGPVAFSSSIMLFYGERDIIQKMIILLRWASWWVLFSLLFSGCFFSGRCLTLICIFWSSCTVSSPFCPPALASIQSSSDLIFASPFQFFLTCQYLKAHLHPCKK